MSGRITELFNNNVFTDAEMKARLPKKVYNEVKACKLDKGSADIVAQAVRDWAIEKGATHFTHVFEPLTMLTAEKHDSFVSLPDEDGKVMMDFTGKELCESEPDGSSFPSGGIRDTSRARSYTSWDMTSPIYVKEDAIGTILCIPAAFCSYTGEALDAKTPLLRSMDAVSEQGVRLLRLLGNTTSTKVTAGVGPEQEYFIVNREKYLERPDLIYAGRTLFGAPAPKGQEMEDQYFGPLKTKIADFMADVDEQLWKLGITVKTQHNEVAPAQHELATIYTTTNVAVDNNQLTMEIMKRVAEKHGLVCLLHEKPFEGINGSGKHNNWSLSTNTGENLLDPDRDPAKNLQFLLFLFATIKAVDVYGDLLRVSVATAGNDHRLGGNEAPPAIVSMFIGDDLEAVLDIVEKDLESEAKEVQTMKPGAKVLPHFIKDTTDRNRTSPFAFTGNKFEFRMPGSALSVSEPNIVINTAVAEVLGEFADRLEGLSGKALEAEIHLLLKEVLRDHRHIVFNGNGYTSEWVEEAHKRGLFDLPSCAEAFPRLIAEKNVELFLKHGIYTKEELFSRYEIKEENYIKTINIEAKTMLSMMKKTFLPSVLSYCKELAETAAKTKAILPNAPISAESKLLEKLSGLYTEISEKTEALAEAEKAAESMEDNIEKVTYFHYTILAKMDDLRSSVDTAEALIPDSFLPYPTYDELLFSV